MHGTAQRGSPPLDLLLSRTAVPLSSRHLNSLLSPHLFLPPNSTALCCSGGAPCTTFLAHHGIHVDQSELATCPLRLSAPRATACPLFSQQPGAPSSLSLYTPNRSPQSLSLFSSSPPLYSSSSPDEHRFQVKLAVARLPACQVSHCHSCKPLPPPPLPRPALHPARRAPVAAAAQGEEKADGSVERSGGLVAAAGGACEAVVRWWAQLGRC
ncbi:unnamed protein product [Closterium sp. NIES-65]|nr:unnamed protein product [Closterium sp. NIES-65]